MKRTILSEILPRKIFGSLALLFCLVQFTSCDKETEIPQIENTPEMSRTFQNCVQGETRWFPLKNGPSINPPDYAIQLLTGIFFLDECLCRVIKFRFVVDEEIPQGQISVKTINGNSVEFTSTWDGLGNTVVEIDDPEPLTGDSYLTGYLDLLQYTYPNYVPPLRAANGLCIIENVGGGPPPTNQLSSPYIFDTFDKDGNPIKQVFIPASMTH